MSYIVCCPVEFKFSFVRSSHHHSYQRDVVLFVLSKNCFGSKILLKIKSCLMTNRNHLKRKNLQALLKKRKKSLNPKVKLSPVLQIHHPNKKLFKFSIVLPVQKRRKHNLNHLISQETEPKKISKSVNQIQKSWA